MKHQTTRHNPLRFISLGIMALLAAMAAGCGPAATPQPGPTASATVEIPASPTASHTPTRGPTSTSTPETATPLPAANICAPLDGITMEQMPQILQYPLTTPHPGQDDGHHGGDYAFYQFGDINGIDGLPIHTMFNGVVAGVANDRKPYGNMIIIETALDEVPPGVVEALALPTPSPILPPDPRMVNCPAEPLPFHLKSTGRSIYLLYAHMQQPATLEPGDTVSCGQQIGLVGNTGMSGNPHLHLEARVGPTGAQFGSMAYYDPGASAGEYANYCTWRISQLFQLLDPEKLLAAGAR